MRQIIIINLMLFIALFLTRPDFFAQSRPDSAATTSLTGVDKQLPQIQLEDYTIIGLAKISLPEKKRTQVFRKVDITWTENEGILNKELPEITFQFSRIKPSLFRLYDFPWMDSKLYYGSYNEVGVAVNMQFKANNTLPYFSAFFGRSDGHLDNAQWTGVGLEAGIHHKFTANHLLHAGTDYRFYKRGIWRDWEIYQQDWEAQSIFWDVFANVESRWNNEFTTRFGGNFGLDEHQSAFKYQDNGITVFGEADYHINLTSVGIAGAYQNGDLSVKEGNQLRDLTDPSGLEEYQASLVSGNFYIRQRFDRVTVEAGGLYQTSDESIRRLDSQDFTDSYFHPYGKITLGVNGVAQIYAGYRPGTELPHFRKDVRSIPFTDLSNLRVINYKSRWEAGFDLDLITNFNVNVVSRYSTVEFFPAPVAPADSLAAVFSNGGYPGWIYGVIDEVQIQELYGKLEWRYRMIEIMGWMKIRNSNIRKISGFESMADENQVPYLPNLTAMGRLRWYFYREHYLTLMLNYVGNRYDDLMNTTELKQYLLFNAGLTLKLNENFRLFIEGKNLLDKGYEEYRGFTAPGITGLIGIRLNM